jgi:hypothetical protein
VVLIWPENLEFSCAAICGGCRWRRSFFKERPIVDMATFTSESTLNRQAYVQLREHIRREHAGQYVALAHGKVIGAASTFDAASALVERLDIVPEYHLVFPANVEPDFDLVYDLAGSVWEMPQVCWSATPRCDYWIEYP